MTCETCLEKASRILALEEELRGYRSIVEGTEDRRAVRMIAVALDLRPRVAALLHRLWLAQGRFVETDSLMDSLSPDRTETDHANSSLRVLVYTARESLGDGAVITKDRAYALGENLRHQISQILPHEKS